MTAFDDQVETWVRTCQSVPTQYQGTLKDGTDYYFRYRSGTLRIGFGTTEMEAVEAAMHSACAYVLHFVEPDSYDYLDDLACRTYMNDALESRS